MTDAASFISIPVMPALPTSTPRLANLTDELHIRLFAVNWMQLKKGEWNAQNVRDSFWRFYINDRDGAVVRTPDRNFPLRANKMYFVAEDVSFSCANSRTFGHFFVHFDVLGLPRPLLQQFFTTPLEIQDADELLQEAGVLSIRLQKSGESTPEIHCRVKALLFGALGRVLSDPSPHDADYWRHIEKQAAVAPALEYIEAHLHEPLSSRVLARVCHWSTDHFARRFRESVGQTPAQYVRTRRIALASQQLLFSEKTIDQIACETGFADRFHFSRVFVQNKHCAPAAYRKRARV